MNREDYLRELVTSMKGLPEEEKKEIAADYDEHFRVGVSSGKSEADIAQELGNPRAIGRSIRIDSMLDDSGSRDTSAVVRAVFAAMSLGFFNVVLVVGPFFALVAVVVSLWAVAAAIGLSGIGLVLGVAALPIFPGQLTTWGFNPAFVLFAGIGFAAVGLLAGIGMYHLTKWVAMIIAKYVRINARIVSNRR